MIGTDGLRAFDLITFLETAKRTRKWVCPHSMKDFSVYDLQVDAYMQRVLQCIQVNPTAVLGLDWIAEMVYACKFMVM